MKHQFLIASYRKDFPWLKYCLRSLARYSTGFLTPVVAIPSEDIEEFNATVDDTKLLARLKVFNGPGFGRAQASMMSGDLLCPEADYVWLLGSDCLATRPFSPADYCGEDGRPVMLWNSWEHMEKYSKETLFWRLGVEKAVGSPSHGEFMRRLPIAYPSALFAATRRLVVAHCNPLGLHNIDKTFNEIVFHRVNQCRNFSESNVMGEIGYRYFRSAYNWVNIDTGCPPDAANLPPGVSAWPVALPIVQHWSHGGLDRPRDQDGRTPREVIKEALGEL